MTKVYVMATCPDCFEVKENGSIGIPCFVKDDGQISFDAEAFLPNGYTSGASCSYDLVNHHHAIADTESCAAIALRLL